MIYTLEYLKTEAEGIVGNWNGSDERFTDTSGEFRTEDDVKASIELLKLITRIEAITEELEI